MAAEGVRTSEMTPIVLPLDNDVFEVVRAGVNNFQIRFSDLKGAIFTMDINVSIQDGSDVAFGAKADAVATTDTGTFTFMGLFKRALQSLTTLRGQLPAALIGGRLGVDVQFPGTQAVSVSSLPLPTGAATSALQTTGNSTLTAIDTKLPALSTGAVPVETIKQALVARQLAAGATSVNTVLTTTCRRIRLYARGADIRYSIGSAAQTANAATSHFLAAGFDIDLALPATPNIAVIAAGAALGVMETTELS